VYRWDGDPFAVTRESVSLSGILVLGDHLSGLIASNRPSGFGPMILPVRVASFSGRVWVDIAAMHPQSRLETSRTKRDQQMMRTAGDNFHEMKSGEK
jgi:hypothetical protein